MVLGVSRLFHWAQCYQLTSRSLLELPACIHHCPPTIPPFPLVLHPLSLLSPHISIHPPLSGNAKFEPGAAVCRLAPSFLRFGSFQLPASRGGLDRDLVRVLADYAIRHHFPELEGLPTPERGGKVEGDGEGEAGQQDPDSVVPTDNKYAGERG